MNQKQPPEVFYKKGVFKKLRKIHKKAHVLESLFNKVEGLRPKSLSKRDPSTGVFQ